ncbi:hypothetical protein [Basfia succiniciproducens]|uniref:hypothetical protein n=1 Tax=Basfia succiniciproducens TaxID=653940 RepID=UPI00115FDAF0|nr:hypothetical protein [Basfia succiniciproducens]
MSFEIYLLQEVKKISRVPCGKPELSIPGRIDAMGHLTRYLLKKASQLFCFLNEERSFAQ